MCAQVRTREVAGIRTPGASAAVVGSVSQSDDRVMSIGHTSRAPAALLPMAGNQRGWALNQIATRQGWRLAPGQIVCWTTYFVAGSGMHILRGLYFHETGNRLCGDSADVRAASKASLTAKHPVMLTIARVFHLFPGQRNGAAGTAFSFAAAFGHSRSVWLMLLFDYFFWIASIDERNASEREADGSNRADQAARV
jgi:hypothetical protein